MYKAIVVGTDGSETAERAVTHAISLAALSGATLHIASAGDEFLAMATVAVGLPTAGDLNPNRTIDGLNRVVSDAAAKAQAKGVNAETHAVTGNVVDALCGLADRLDADLLIVGNRGMQGIQRFFWDSVADSISHKAPCSVLIVDTRSEK